jgi:6-phosphofructokinase 1
MLLMHMTDKNNISGGSHKRSELRNIGVLTSGGDAQGMNAAIRAVARPATAKKLKVAGIRRGYQGMIGGDFIPFRSSDVSGIIQLGGNDSQNRTQE